MSLKTCSCGHDRYNPRVVRRNEYTFWAKFGLFTGISVKPIYIRYLCTVCNQIFDETDDPVELQKYLM